MSIILPEGLPAAQTLAEEGLQVLTRRAPGIATSTATLRVALVNLMPDKVATETQFARLLGDTPFRVDLSFFVPEGYQTRSTPAAHLRAFYTPWSTVRRQRFDALIVTGAPVERLPFAEVRYWDALRRVFDWSAGAVGRTLTVCWGAQAALQHAHGVPKTALPAKLSGVYPQTVVAPSPILRGLGPMLLTPVSRYTGVDAAALPAGRGLRVLARSAETGLCLVEDAPGRAHHLFNHPEYDADTLGREFARDLRAGLPARLPVGYFPGDNAALAPVATWRPQALRLFRNWLGLVARPETAALPSAELACSLS